LGNAIDKELKWVELTDTQQKEAILHAGLHETFAHNYTEMGNAIRTGIMQAHARESKPAFMSIKLEDFAKEFAAAFQA
jgi:hypothetical protein